MSFCLCVSVCMCACAHTFHTSSTTLLNNSVNIANFKNSPCITLHVSKSFRIEYYLTVMWFFLARSESIFLSNESNHHFRPHVCCSTHKLFSRIFVMQWIKYKNTCHNASWWSHTKHNTTQHIKSRFVYALPQNPRKIIRIKIRFVGWINDGKRTTNWQKRFENLSSLSCVVRTGCVRLLSSNFHFSLRSTCVSLDYNAEKDFRYESYISQANESMYTIQFIW